MSKEQAKEEYIKRYGRLQGININEI